MDREAASPDVLIVGAGPVGLMLACLLEQRGIETLVLERRCSPTTHSRAIGIHRPSLSLLDRLGVAQRFISAGVPVPGGAAVSEGRVLGALRFDEVGGPFPFALSLPQADTERLLEQVLRERAPARLDRGCDVIELARGDRGVCVTALKADGERVQFQARHVVGCDGERSVVRRLSGISFDGAHYPDAFVMGDFGDNTSFGPEARLFLSRQGLVESFPLPEGRRRWVASTQERWKQPSRQAFARVVRARTGWDLDGQPCTMLSTFGIQSRLAQSFVAGPIALAGDAAHVMSPIGGQGLNLGWLDAWDLAAALDRVVRSGRDDRQELARYGKTARGRARKVMRRAAFNTFMGRGTPLDPVRNAVVRVALHTPLRRRLVRMFSMQDLGFADDHWEKSERTSTSRASVPGAK